MILATIIKVFFHSIRKNKISNKNISNCLYDVISSRPILKSIKKKLRSVLLLELAIILKNEALLSCGRV